MSASSRTIAGDGPPFTSPSSATSARGHHHRWPVAAPGPEDVPPSSPGGIAVTSPAATTTTTSSSSQINHQPTLSPSRQDVFPNLPLTQPLHHLTAPNGLFSGLDDMFSFPMPLEIFAGSSMDPNPAEFELLDQDALDAFINSHTTTDDSAGLESHASDSGTTLVMGNGSMFDTASQVQSHIEMQTPQDSCNTTLLSEPDVPQALMGGGAEDCSSGSCLQRMLSIIQKLSHTQQPPIERAEKYGYGPKFDDHSYRHLLSAESIIAHNRPVLDTVADILQCSCSQDSHLLVLITLTLFKALTWYAAAASGKNEILKNQTCPKDSSPAAPSPTSGLVASTAAATGYGTPSSVGISEQQHLAGHQEYDRDRMASQLVLSELSRMQGIVKTLSQNLAVLRHRSDGGGGRAVNEKNVDQRAGGAYHSTSSTTITFSFALFEQLEVDLRRRLRGLSAEIMERLRHV
ncbi:hypothetical protein M406DRAFT_73663 [Cryphonectria parasitica EP155]|uniref:Aflatoxin regulatory protein domain-containing protein n=1 Tax=Cryphonectria parasitica (strain ATCC 38755 / EP155) TaxID=660469 RepID=A0A9P4XY11_CRYP1|nr:uncharacterized protein M406DRAFT_73663 [Cryphonectria parasitica EP155]KAF3763006.1 hypothetical protein M406DRAFT_73663 [Cryphonectria parasitica EP155]